MKIVVIRQLQRAMEQLDKGVGALLVLKSMWRLW